MPKFIVYKLFAFYEFNKNISNILNNNFFNQCYIFNYNAYCIIKPNWIWNFLYSYNYPKIFPIFENHKDQKACNNSEEIINEFHKIINDNKIKDIFPTIDFKEEENINKILR